MLNLLQRQPLDSKILHGKEQNVICFTRTKKNKEHYNTTNKRPVCFFKSQYEKRLETRKLKKKSKKR